MGPVPVEVFSVVSDPTRRRILGELANGEHTVGELVGSLGLPQPTVSKHLKVLRDGGFVTRRTMAQRRVYRLEPAPFAAIDAWLEPYRRLWNHHLDALERHLDKQEQP